MIEVKEHEDQLGGKEGGRNVENEGSQEWVSKEGVMEGKEERTKKRVMERKERKGGGRGRKGRELKISGRNINKIRYIHVTLKERERERERENYCYILIPVSSSALHPA